MKCVGWLLIGAVVFYSQAHGFIYEIKAAGINKGRQGQVVIGCSDYHDKVHPISCDQRKKIESLFKGCNPASILVLVEDLSSKNNCGTFACQSFYVSNQKGILAGLTQSCVDCGLPVQNLEYRYCRVTSLGPVLNQCSAPINSFISTATISVAHLLEEVQNIIDEVRAYHDGALLQKMYHLEIERVIARAHEMQLPAYSSSTVAQYLERITGPDRRIDFLKRLLTFDSTLLDLRLVHHIVNASQVPTIVVFAGGTHITNLFRKLDILGYKPLPSTKLSYMRERDIGKCVGANIIDGLFCVKPQPVDLGLLERYLKERQ